MNFDSTNGRAACRVSEIAFSYPAGATSIEISIRKTEVLRDADGLEHEIEGRAQILRSMLDVSSLGELVPLHDVKTGAPLGQSLPKAVIMAAINSLCRQIIEAQ